MQTGEQHSRIGHSCHTDSDWTAVGHLHHGFLYLDEQLRNMACPWWKLTIICFWCFFWIKIIMRKIWRTAQCSNKNFLLNITREHGWFYSCKAKKWPFLSQKGIIIILKLDWNLIGLFFYQWYHLNMSGEQNRLKFDSIGPSSPEEEVWPVRVVLRSFTTFNIE